MGMKLHQVVEHLIRLDPNTEVHEIRVEEKPEQTTTSIYVKPIKNTKGIVFEIIIAAGVMPPKRSPQGGAP